MRYSMKIKNKFSVAKVRNDDIKYISFEGTIIASLKNGNEQLFEDYYKLPIIIKMQYKQFKRKFNVC